MIDIVLLISPKTTAPQHVILSGKLSTIIIFKLCKLSVNLWTLCFLSYKKYIHPLRTPVFSLGIILQRIFSLEKQLFRFYTYLYQIIILQIFVLLLSRIQQRTFSMENLLLDFYRKVQQIIILQIFVFYFLQIFRISIELQMYIELHKHFIEYYRTFMEGFYCALNTQQCGYVRITSLIIKYPTNICIK